MTTRDSGLATDEQKRGTGDSRCFDIHEEGAGDLQMTRGAGAGIEVASCVMGRRVRG
ncbi:uncharacterized protein DS421_3g87350 [Arachis hypogaea]|nr:uncharacterized protein DS421_3g87350 [Arachis hypogaea]